MSDKFVDYTQVDASKIIGSTPESKQIPNGGGSYLQLPLSYDYGTPESPLIDNFYLQFPVVSSSGIMEKLDEKTGKRSYSMYIPLPKSDEAVKTFLDKFSQIFRSTADIIFKYRGQCKVTAQTVDMMIMAGLYKDPVYYPRDKATNEIIQGRSPSMYLKLLKRGVGASEQKTLFCDLKGNPIDWKLLYGAEMKLIPLVHVESIYIGTKPSLQLKMVSAIVLEVHQRGSQTRQMSTIQKIVSENPDSVTALERQIAKLAMERQDSAVPPPLHHNTGNDDANSAPQTNLQNFLAGNVTVPSTPTVPKGSPLNIVPPSPKVTIPQIPFSAPTSLPITQNLN
jgi:hypothetical protein